MPLFLTIGQSLSVFKKTDAIDRKMNGWVRHRQTNTTIGLSFLAYIRGKKEKKIILMFIKLADKYKISEYS